MATFYHHQTLHIKEPNLNNNYFTGVSILQRNSTEIVAKLKRCLKKTNIYDAMVVVAHRRLNQQNYKSKS